MLPFAVWLVWGTYFVFLYLIIFWLLVLIRENRLVVERGGLIESKNKPSDYPTVTVAIPAWNAEENIRDTIESVMGLDYSPDKLEIIIVNDGSTDQTEAMAKRAMRQYAGRKLRLITQPNRGKGGGLDTALQKDRGGILAA